MPKRGSGKLYELNGERHTLTEWCKLYGVPVQRTQGRISRGNYTPLRSTHNAAGEPHTITQTKGGTER